MAHYLKSIAMNMKKLIGMIHDSWEVLDYDEHVLEMVVDSISLIILLTCMVVI